MTTWTRKYWWVAIIIILFSSLPIGLNFLLNINIGASIIGNSKDWLMFWGSYIGGFASFIMLFIAWKTLMETKHTNRPYIHMKIIKKLGVFYLECSNLGKSTAYSIKIEFPAKFKQTIPLSIIKSNIEDIEKADFPLPPGEKQHIKLCYGHLNKALLKHYGGNINTNKITFDSTEVSMIDSNKNIEYFDNALKYILVHYNDEYNEKKPISTSIYEDAPQDMLTVIAFRLEAIEKHLGTIANNRK